MSNWYKAYNGSLSRLGSKLREILEDAFEGDMEADRMNNKFKGQKNHKSIIEPMRIRDTAGASTNAGNSPDGIARIRKPFDFCPTKDELGKDASDNQKFIAFDCSTTFVHFKHGAGPVTPTSPGTQVFLQNCAAGNDPAYDGTTTGLRILNSYGRGDVTTFGKVPGITDLNWPGNEVNGDASEFDYPGRKARFFKEADRKPGDVKFIVLHSTDGDPGDGEAQDTIDRFANGPTLAFRWTNKNTGKVIENPPCTDVLSVDGELPHGTICHPVRKKVETPVKTSIHYAVDQGGNIIQGLEEKNVAYHAKQNNKSIGIEMCGEPHKGPNEGYLGLYAKMYDETLLRTTAKLCAEICERWNLVPSLTTIVGHEALDPGRRKDPGASLNSEGKSYWDWTNFLSLVQSYYKGGTI